MKIHDHTVDFFIGAATMGEGDGKWSWPARDLAYLYRRKFNPGITCSIEPDIATWRRFGCMTVFIEGQGLRMMQVDQFANHFGEEKTLELLARCPGTYLSKSKDEILDTLGCPK